ncbi:MAG: hypothetical protein IJV98_08975 [Clostridia bacterium]|nr:hypothetical protein [Clostridia bacterium]
MKISEFFASLLGKKTETPVDEPTEEMQEQTDVVEEPTAQPEVERYSPELRRGEAIEIAKRANALKEEAKYDEAIALLRESCAVLEEIVTDGETGECFDLGEVTDRDEAVKAQCAECLRELGRNAHVLALTYVEMRDEVLCREAVDQAERYFTRLDALCSDKESAEDLAVHYYTAFHIGHYLNDEELMYQNAVCYQETMMDGDLKDHDDDDTALDDLTLSCDIIFEGIKNRPERGQTYLATLTAHAELAAVNGDAELGSVFAVLAMKLLKLVTENAYTWEVGGKLAQAQLIYVIRLAVGTYAEQGEPERCSVFTGFLERFPDDTFHGEARYEYRSIYAELGDILFAAKQYEAATEHYVRVFELMQAVVPDEYAPAKLFADMIRLVPAYCESGNIELAEACGERALRYSRYVLSNGYGQYEEARGITEEQWRSELCVDVAELYLNLGIVSGRRAETDKMMQYFECAAAFVEEIGDADRERGRDILKRIKAVLESTAI